jgi:PhnB protein
LELFASRALDFYQEAFDAKEILRMDGPPEKIAHAEMKIGHSIIMLADEMPGAGCRAPKSLGGSSGGIFLYVEDVDAAFDQAVGAGARVEMPLADMFWGDRSGKLTDPFGHSWSLATHKEDGPPQELRSVPEEAMTKMSNCSRSAKSNPQGR